jgi:hypothetical protein
MRGLLTCSTSKEGLNLRFVPGTGELARDAGGDGGRSGGSGAERVPRI